MKTLLLLATAISLPAGLVSCTSESKARLETAAIDGLAGAAQGYASGGSTGAKAGAANAFASGLRPPTAQK